MLLDQLKSKSRDPKLLESALLDCYGRFLVTLPEEEYHNPVRLCFHIQEAWWWYIDHWVQKYPHLLANYSLKSFIKLVSIDCELVRAVIGKVDLAQIETEWRHYRNKIPVRGGILVNKTLDKVLLVKGFNSSQWTFPRGKADEQEDDVKCAVREISEETGIDVSKLINPKNYIELFLNGRSVKLFIIFNVDDKQINKPILINEIEDCRWISISLLRKKDNNIVKTYNVVEFLPDLCTFINKYRRKFHFNKHNNPFIDCSSDSNSITDGETAFGLKNPKFGYLGKGKWEPEDMFRINREKFGVVSTYNIEHYNTVPKTRSTIAASNKKSNDYTFIGSNCKVLPADNAQINLPSLKHQISPQLLELNHKLFNETSANFEKKIKNSMFTLGEKVNNNDTLDPVISPADLLVKKLYNLDKPNNNRLVSHAKIKFQTTGDGAAKNAIHETNVKDTGAKKSTKLGKAEDEGQFKFILPFEKVLDSFMKYT